MRIVAAVLIATLAWALPLPGRAQTEADTAAVQGVIRNQLEAFKRDDGAAAYAYAAPNIQRIFPTAEAFMAMVRGVYQPVYRPRQYSFGALESRDGVLVQAVEIVDADGQIWTAVYTLEHEPDGSWKITACHLVRSEGTTA
ncbi:DUF4864 domain-containing protein [Labrys wisconsinensis]|uniref:DUF4864 domain-containing protein n=1 Tax=Labrys wisconsinensis TaxID=425677 RepID=A0ABU0J4J8_9HYPH|nr:DUF4864 domain-containing protein [Labrys wisconsinensis]MDQ0469192.1 hypothetical protein [Labrys wisconsinensis]